MVEDPLGSDVPPVFESERMGRAVYVSTVKRLCPAATGASVDLHCSMMTLRDSATSSLRYCSDEASTIYSEIVRLASQFGLSQMPTGNLQLLRNALLRLTLAATNLELFSTTYFEPFGDLGEDQ